MKSSLRYLIILTLTMLLPLLAAAQKANFTTNSGLTLGFGLGAAYQNSDIPNSIGAGFDFTLGHNLGKKEGVFLRPDWKFRFLMGENRAYDHRINTDGTYSNIQYSFFNYDLELGLTLNRLRERTKIVVTGFGGAGIVHGRTFADLLDDAGNPYDYSTIDPARDRDLVYADLLDISDGNFETRLVNKAAIMPTLGFYIGYQFSKSFSLGIEHKTSFSMSEENTAWGINIDNNVAGSSRRDRNSYTTLGFRWALGGGGSYYSYPTDRISYPPVTSLADSVPARTITRDTAITRTPPVIRNTGISTSTTPPVTTTPPTRTTTTNPVRTTTTTTPPVRTTTTTTNPPVTSTTPPTKTVPVKVTATIPLPEIRFINPSSPVTVQNNTFRISAQTSGIKSWDDVELKVNNYIFSNFTLSPEGMITTNIGLSEGLNTIEIKGKNETGEVTASTTITYNKAVAIKPVPVITIILPERDGFSTYDQSIRLTAQITNIAGRQTIKLMVNGSELSNFEYDHVNGTLNADVPLREGRNNIQINASNESGSGTASRSVTKEERPCPSPTITITEPSVSLNNTTSQNQFFRAEITNVASANQLRMTLNGNSITSFAFNGREVSYNTSLKEGVNIFSLTATNECGTSNLTKEITFTPVVVTPCPKPAVSFAMAPVQTEGVTHELKGVATNINSRNEITMTVDGKAYDAFSFVQSTGEISARFRFEAGSHNVVVTVMNECGKDSRTSSVSVKPEEKPCGVRINPGNSDWQFCLITPNGTFNRSNLSNENFSYSGSASSLFLMPIAGGGDATVNGQPYQMRSGQYYLFTGNLKVTVSTKNQGSMGQWSVCIESDKPPVSGNGNNRPKSPCEDEQSDTTKVNVRVKKISDK